MQASTQQNIVYFLIIQRKQKSAIKRECFTVCPLSPTLEEKLKVPRWPTDDVGILDNWDGFGAGCSVQLMGQRTVSLIMIQTLGIRNLRACQL
jgi:hypothetical protein